jgi:hypothetical protein
MFETQNYRRSGTESVGLLARRWFRRQRSLGLEVRSTAQRFDIEPEGVLALNVSGEADPLQPTMLAAAKISRQVLKQDLQLEFWK